MAHGVVKTFSESKGYGYITPMEGGKDLHVQATALKTGSPSGLKEGVKVEYTANEGPKGHFASDVQIVPSPSATTPEPAMAAVKVSIPTATTDATVPPVKA